MKKRNCVALAAIAILLMAALLFTGCDPMDISGLAGKTPDNAPNMGTLRLNIGGSNARTIMPNALDNEFDSYKFTLKDNTTKENIPGYIGLPITFDGSIGEIEVPEGTYTVQIDAQIDDVIAATGTADDVTITDQGGTANITLNVIRSGSGTGTFSWEINLPAGINALETAKLEIYNLAGTALHDPQPSQPDLITANEGTMALPTGYYRVVITMGKEKHQSRVITEILHIYQGMTSSYTPALTTPLVRNIFDVIYFLNEDDQNPEEEEHETIQVNWNAMITHPTPPSRISEGFAFLGWFTSPTDDTTEWNITTRVYNDIKLYAQWDEVVLPELEVNITFAIPGDIFDGLAFDQPNYSISLSDIGNGLTINITTNEDDWDSTTWELSYGGIDPVDLTSVTHTKTTLELDAILTAGISEDPPILEYTVTVIILKDGYTYGGSFIVTITQ
ncbi:MAG: InlB B-repeat-containing protein [Treponema sp.]|nr:InlB B-repeat-containing protein [Treponema sp.]